MALVKLTEASFDKENLKSSFVNSNSMLQKHHTSLTAKTKLRKIEV